MQINEARKAIVIVGKVNAQIVCHSSDGEIIFTEGLKLGRHDVKQWVEFMSEGDKLTLTGNASFLLPSLGRVRRMANRDGASATGANPDYKPTSADKMRRRMLAQMKTLSKRSDLLERKQMRMEAAQAARIQAAIDESIVIDEPLVDPVVDPAIDPVVEPVVSDAVTE